MQIQDAAKYAALAESLAIKVGAEGLQSEAKVLQGEARVLQGDHDMHKCIFSSVKVWLKYRLPTTCVQSMAQNTA